jgi:hypothetical protein
MVLAFVLGLVVAMAGSATAARLITGKQIKDGSISSKDLSKTLRAQLRKAGLAGPVGAQGPKGDPGSAGSAGSVGPTDGAAANGDTSPLPHVPAAVPDLSPPAIEGTTLTTTHAGRLMVFLTVTNVAVDCSSGYGLFGAYLDGVPVPETTVVPVGTSANGFPTLSVSGVTAGSIPAGKHRISWGLDCAQGNLTNHYTNHEHAAVIVLGQ